eukprot:757870-Karenia_brevis.AAC.1
MIVNFGCSLSCFKPERLHSIVIAIANNSKKLQYMESHVIKMCINEFLENADNIVTCENTVLEPTALAPHLHPAMAVLHPSIS